MWRYQHTEGRCRLQSDLLTRGHVTARSTPLPPELFGDEHANMSNFHSVLQIVSSMYKVYILGTRWRMKTMLMLTQCLFSNLISAIARLF